MRLLAALVVAVSFVASTSAADRLQWSGRGMTVYIPGKRIAGAGVPVQTVQHFHNNLPHLHTSTFQPVRSHVPAPVYGGYGGGYGYNNYGYNGYRSSAPSVGSFNISTPTGMSYGTTVTVGNAVSGQYVAPDQNGILRRHGFYQYQIPGGGTGGWSW